MAWRACSTWGSHGLSLTADGERYLESCRPLLEQLAQADEALGAAAERARGEVVVVDENFGIRILEIVP